MKQILFLLIGTFVMASGFCSGQGDSAVSGSNHVIQWRPNLYLFNKPAPLFKPLLYSGLGVSGSRFDPRNLNLPVGWSDEVLNPYDRQSYLWRDQYPRYWKAGMDIPYDPLNPYGATNIESDLIMGALNFLLFQLAPPCK